MRQRAPMVSGSGFSRSKPVNASDLVNLYYETADVGSKTPGCLYGAAGLRRFADLGAGKPIRGMHYFPKDDLVYAVCEGFAYRIDSGGGVVRLGSVGTTESGVYVDNNGVTAFMLDPVSSAGYALTPSGVAQITDADFSAFGSVAVLNGFAVFTRKDTDQFFISGLRDIFSYDPLDFATAEAAPDKNVRNFATLNELWVFGAKTIQPYRNTGGRFPLTSIKGAEISQGLGAPLSVAETKGAIVWLDDEGTIWGCKGGYVPEKISTHGMDDEIRRYDTYADAQAFCHSENGHNFYTITFPSAGKTFCFDFTTGRWHRRRTYGKGRLRANCFARAWGRNLVGDFENGVIYEFDEDVFTDDGLPQEAEFVLPSFSDGANNVVVHELQVDIECGTSQEYSEQPLSIMSLQMSEDGGMTWSQEAYADCGRKGERTQEAVFRRIGYGRNMAFKGRVSHPMMRAIAGVNVRIEARR